MNDQPGVLGPSQVELVGRILYLTEDPDLVNKQLAGHDLDPHDLPKLKDDLSTDEITPARSCLYFDKRLGEFVYTGLNCGNKYPVGRGEVRRGNFVVSVAGKRRGKGSSREQSPFAEIAAGIKLVIGESFERIYEQNCQNLGLLTSTDFGLLPRIARGEKIDFEEFTKDKDEITRQIIRYGGLFPFNQARLRGQVSIPSISS
ncbi:MAG: 3-isopropylmalate dehydratase, partial [Blastocatellia bacterium]|nr:3-isopropylmalate dehydratase [Blastocatellia bacterium]